MPNNLRAAVAAAPQVTQRVPWVKAERDLAFIGFVPQHKSPIREFCELDSIAESPTCEHPVHTGTFRRTRVNIIGGAGELLVFEVLETEGKVYERSLYRGINKRRAITAANAAHFYLVDHNYVMQAADKNFKFEF